jgi:hypothetical protein
MTPEQKNREIEALRKFYSSTKERDAMTFAGLSARFWLIVDRIFRWRVMLIKVRNPFFQDQAPAGRSDDYLSFQCVTDKPHFSLETLLDEMVGVMQRNVFSKVRRHAQGFVIKTECGKYEIVIHEYKG